MNYRFRYIVFICLLFAISFNYAKSQNKDKPVVVKNRTNAPNIRNNTSSKNDENEISNSFSSFMKIKSNNIENASWKRIILRKVNLEDPNNEALDYMITSDNNRKNLFSIIFNLFINGNINCYEYIDAIELFDASHKLPPKDIIEKFQINHKIESNRYIVNDVDIPLRDVRSYYIKEVYFFDQSTSEFKREVLAICPVITMLNDYGEEMRIPMFWVVYDDLRPFLSNEYVSISDMNMVDNYSLADFIDLNMYKGDIVRLGNKSINNMASSPDSVNIVQEKIEKQLSDIVSSFNKTTTIEIGKQTKNSTTNDESNKKNSRDKKVYNRNNVSTESKSSPSVVRSVRR